MIDLWNILDEARLATIAAAGDRSGPAWEARRACWEPSGTHPGCYGLGRSFEPYTMDDLRAEAAKTVDTYSGGRCLATVLSAHFVHAGHGEDHLQFRGACLACGWIGEPRRGLAENEATEDALDHAWPGWRDLPVIEPEPRSKGKGWDAWRESVYQAHPEGWLQAAGPVVERRDPGPDPEQIRMGRHVPMGAPGHGYRCADFRIRDQPELVGVGQQLTLL